MSKILRKAGLFFISLVLSFLVGEWFIRNFYPQQLIRIHGIYRPDAELGWRHVESIRTTVNTGEAPVIWATDAHGFRVSPFEKERQNPSKISILMIGDSFVEALAVDYEKTVPHQIHERLEKKHRISSRVVNAGVGGWEPGQYFLEIRRLLNQSQYDLGLIFFYMENDFVDTFRLTFIPKNLEPSKKLKFPKELKWEAFKKDVFFPINNFLEERSHLFVFLKDRFRILLARLGLTAYYFPDVFYVKEKDSPKWDVAAATAERIYREFQHSHTPSLFVLLPADYQVYPHLFSNYIKMFGISPESVDLEQPNQKFAASLRRRSIHYIDMLPILRQKAAEGLQLYGSIDNHLNGQGHAAVTEAILPWIEEILTKRFQV